MTRDRFVFSSLTLPRRCLLVLVAGLPLAVPFLCAQTVKEAGADQAKEDARASDPLGPARDALADRDWARAVRLLARLRDEAPQTSAGQEAALLQSRAYLLSGEKDEAAKVLAEFLATDPEPAWAVPARLLLAGALESAGEFRGASEIYRDRLAFLRGGEYLSWLVSFYLEIADPAYEGREVDDPSSILPRKIIQHDYPTALEYYLRARRIFIPPERENEVDLRIGHSYLEMGNVAAAREELESLLGIGDRRDEKTRPALTADIAARALFHLATAYERSHRLLDAIKTFSRVEAEHTDHELVPRAVARIAYDWLSLWRGESPESASRATADRVLWLDSALQTIDRFVDRYPQNDEAPKLALEKARALLQAGRTDDAIRAFAAVVERFASSDAAPLSLFEIARIETERHRYAEAIAALERFLVLFPTNTRWTEAKSALVATILRSGIYLLHERKDREGARAVFERVLVEHPLSSEAPLAYLGIFESLAPPKEDGGIRHHASADVLENGASDTPAARDAWTASLVPLRALAGKYDSSPQAPTALLLIARILHEKLDRLEDSIAEYEALVARYPQTAQAAFAREVLGRLREHRLEVLTPGIIASDEPWSVRIETRNVPRLKFKAYRVNLEEYFRRKHRIDAIQEVEVGIVAPTKVWEADVPGYRPFRIEDREWKLELPEDEVGAYILTVEEIPTDDVSGDPSKAPLYATTLVLRTDLGFVTKHSATSTFVWAFDPRTSEPVEGARVLLATGGEIFAENTTGTDGVARFDHETARPEVRAFASRKASDPIRGTHWAVDAAESGPRVAAGYSTKAHITTDRPLYRPGQEVHFRAILRKERDGQYASSEGEKAHVAIRNPLGVILLDQELTANEFGAIAGEVLLGEEPPLGEYAIDVVYRDASFTTTFFVEEYRKPELAVSLSLPRSTYLPQEKVEGKIVAEYLFGAPVANASIEWHLFRGPFEFDRSRFDEFRWFFERREVEDRSRDGLELVASGSGTTDASGELEVAFDPQVLEPDRAYRVFIEAVDITGIAVQGMGSFVVSRQGIFVVARAHRKVYRPGDEAVVTFRTVDANARPLDVEGELVLLRSREPNLPPEEISRRPLATRDGKVDASLTLERPGEYAAVFRVRDRAGTLVEGEAELHVAGEIDESREARLLAEKAIYKQGEEATLHISSPVEGRHALLTFEASGVIRHRVVRLEGRASEARATMLAEFSPNVHVAIAIPGRKKLFTATDEIIVLQYLDVAIEAPTEPVLPGGDIEITITATDQAGEPVEGELSLAVVDRSIFELKPSLTESIKPFFYDQRRTLGVATGSSLAFRYEGITRRIDIEVLAELEEAQAQLGAAGAFGGRPGATTASRARPNRRAGAMPESAVEFGVEADETAAYAAPPMENFRKQLADSDAAKKREEKALALDSLRAQDSEGVMNDSPVAAPVLRRRFADTAYWSPSVRTGADGRARVRIELPDNLTEWRVTAIGSTRGHLFGEGETSFVVSKDLLTRLAAPRFLTRADRAIVKTPIHNYGDDEANVSVRVKGDGIAVPGGTSASFLLPAGGVRAPEWELVPPPARSGVSPFGKLTIEALAERDSDALEQAVPILPYGRPRRGGASGVLHDSVLHVFELPAERVPGTAFVEVSIFPHHVDALLDTVFWLRHYPYGCVEQTVSGFLPLVAVAEALESLGTPRADLRNLLETLVPQRIIALLNLQQPSGGWGWWGADGKDDPDPQMTGLALLALERCRLLGYRVQQDRLERARAKAQELLSRVEPTDLQALLLYSLSLSRSAPEDARARLYRIRERLGPAALGLLALAEHSHGREGVARELSGVLAALAIELEPSPVIPLPRPRRLVGFTRERPDDPSSIEAAAWALRAIDSIEPESPLAARLAESLLSLRRGIHWGTTKASAAAVMALAAHYSRSRAVAVDEIELLVNGRGIDPKRIVASEDRKGAFDLRLDEADLATGTNRIEIRSDAGRSPAWAIRHAYYEPAEALEREGSLVRIARRYEPIIEKLPSAVSELVPPRTGPRKDPRDVLTEWASPVQIAGNQASWLLEPQAPVPGHRIIEAERRPARTKPTLDKAPAGEAFLVRLRVEARSDLEYMMIEDPIPAGCEPIDDDDDRFQGPFDRYEVRDDKIVFFAARLARGSHEFSYRLRPVFPGSYGVLPALIEGMYEPAIQGLSETARLEILKAADEPPPEEREPNTPDELLFFAERDWARLGGPRADALALAPLLDRYRSIERLQHLDSAYRDLVLARIAAIELATGRAAEALSVVEELRRRNPRLIGGLGDLGAIADAYHAERQFRLGLTWQSRLFDELYQRDRNVRDTLWSIGERLESQTVGLYLVRTYPHSNRTIGDAFELARRYAAIEAPPSTGRKGALHAEAVESLAEFIAWFPTTPLAPQAEHLVIQSLTTMGDLDAVAVESERFRTRYPNHPLVDEALFAGLEAQFERRDYDAVVKSARALIDGRFPTEGKREPQPSPFATGARWILAKTLHIQGEIAAAVSEYRALESLVPEAKDALAWLTARELEVPEIVQSGTSEKSTLEIEWKNLDRLSIQIYRVDLPLLFASRKDLRGISSVDLTGIEPERELVIALEGEPYVAQKTKIDLPLEKAGVWLINARSENRVGSSVVLRSDLSVDVRRKDERIQVFVSPPGSAKVKVSDGSRVVASGNADARGFFEAVVGGRKASVLVERDGHFALWNE